MYLKDALVKYYEGLMAKHRYNVEVYLTNPAGIGEHSDIIEAVDIELGHLVDAQDKLEAVRGLNYKLMPYNHKVIDHYENPRNVGSMNDKDEDVGTGMVGAPACGDVMRLQIRVSDEDIITDAKFKTYGCGSAIASSSLLTEWVKGRSLDDANSIKNMDLANELALPPVKIHCSVLAEDAIKTAIRDVRQKREQNKNNS